MKISQITDGTSKTMMIAEKYVRSDEYDAGLNSDDQGWSDGYDADSSRSTAFLPINDGDPIGYSPGIGDRYFADPPGGGYQSGPVTLFNLLHFGSAHTSGINAVFADGAVHTINYDVDLVLFNALATRAGMGCGLGGPSTPEPVDISAAYN